MANYDDVVEKNKRYLTQAQINALAEASKQYNIQNAGNRAGALASAREQFDTGYRGLQNMGLAGATPMQPTSGEVPRLVQDIRTPFDDYNRRLNDVEHRRLDALGGQFAQQTQAARAAAQQAAAERARQETLQQQYQRAQAVARAINIKSIPSAPKLNPRDLVQESVKEFDETPTAAERAALKYQQDGIRRTAEAQQQAALNAAAELLGVTGPNNMKQAEQVRLDRELATARDVQNTVTQATKPILNQKTGDQYTYDTYSEAKEVQRAADNIAAKATRAAQANKKNDTTEQDEQALKEAQANVDYIDSLYKKMAKGEDLTDAEIQAMSQERVAVQQRDLAKEKLENPEKYAARLVLSDPTKRGTTAWTKATHLMAPEIADNVLESMGISKPNMTDEQFTADMQDVKDVRRSLDVIDSLRQEQENKRKTGTTGAIDYDQQFIDEELEALKKLGYTEAQARKLVKRVSNERQTRSEYEYYQKALQTEIENDGLKPSKPVNQSETDTTYRLANNLPSMNLVAKSDYEALATAPAGPAEYMNDKQRNTYNALYETEGIEAANKYVEDISPLLNLERARQDKDYREKMVNANWFSGAWQNLLSVGTNLIGNVPAMLEKLAITGYNAIANPDVPVYIDQNSGLSQLSNRTNYIREATSERILKNHNNTWGKVFNFAYQSGMSMADSAAAMAVAGVLGNTHAVDALFFSSAGNEAYRDARERGATQDQAMGFAVLSGAAEAIFEHVSVETFANQFIRQNAKARRSTIAKLLIQSGTEASEEVTTEIANKLADAWVMGDKSEYDLKVKELMSKDKTLTKEQAEKKAFMDALKDVGMAGLGGLVSGLGFGLTGAIATKKSETKTGKAVKENGKLDRLTRAAKLFGGDVAQQAAEVEAGKQSDAQVGSLLHELQLAQNEALGIDSESNEQMTEAQAEELAKKGEALDVIMEGEQITADDAQKVIETLGADKLAKMGYDASSADAFAKSYNNTLQRQNIAPMSEVNKAEREFAQGKAVEELREESFERVYKNPKQGLAYEADGKTITPLPGNLTAVAFAEQERSNFKARTTATNGNVTYAFSGMQAREGMRNEQTLAEMQKALTKEARNKAEVYSKLASALGIKMTIHDVMTGTNGFIDESGNMHVVLSGKQSVLRVAAHELTHWMKGNNSTGYASLRQHLVNEVGADRFDRMLKQKAREYGIDTSTEKGRTVADDEVCAELCERMLSNEEALEKFAEKDTEAAKSLKDRLLKILNAIKQALKDVKNRDFGESWSDLIHEQDTIESWITGLQQAIDNANERAKTNEGFIGNIAGVTTVDQQEMTDEIHELFMDEETARKQSLKQAAEESGKKKTYVRGYSAKEVESVISSGLLGDKSNYEGDDYENARGMIAQLIPDIAAALNGEADLEEVNDKVKAAVGAMYDNYFEDNGDMGTLRAKIPTVIAVDNTAKTDLTDENLFGMSAKLSKALGRKVTLVSKASAQFKNAAQLADVWEDVRDTFGLSESQDFSVDIPKLLKFIQEQTDTRKTAKEVFGSSLQDEIDATAANIVEAVSEVVEAKVDKIIAEHSVDVIEYDMAGYAEDLFKAGMSQNDITVLFDTMNKAIDKVKAHRAILDYGAELSTEEEVIEAKKNRAYLPYKQNADPHYKLALDFSTLCRKRVLLQTIQERLQAKMGRATTQEETVAIRLALQKLQREGYKVEVACALCYVEAARLKSPKVINAFLNNTANEMRNYFAKKNPESKAIIEGLQQQWKVDHGLAPDATKNDMKAAGVNVTEYNNYSRDLREQFEGSANEETIVARALDLVKNHRNVFLSASELTKLKKSDPDIFSAFTDKVRSATRSKAQETDTFYSRGDINMVTEAILNYANAESGFRHQSWSDFVPTHLLDTMAAVIEMSTRKAKMHAYTKVPAMVRLLGKTGMALNMSLIPSGNTGIDANGNLSFDSVEGMPWEVMMELRDMFPETAGNIAIGINGEQIQKLLASKDIDYVIPYHASGMNKNMRGYLDIRAWSEYTSSQNEKTNHRGTKGKAPELAEWFDEKAAAKATDGEAFMREASEKYLHLCYERNLTPKFAQYLQNNGDGSYSLKEGYENYWKMLTDRKMVNQKTGKVIIQQAVKPTFDQDTVLGTLEDRLNDPAIQDAERAADIVTEQFSGWRADRNNADAEAIQAAKDLRDRTAAITAQKTAEAGGVNYSLDTDAIRQAFTVIDTEGIEDGLEALKDVKHVGMFALKDISRMLDASAGKNKDLRNTLHAIFEKPHSEATGRYARGVERMQQRVLDIAKRAGVVDAKGKRFDSKKSAAIQNIGEGFSNTYTNVKVSGMPGALKLECFDPTTGKHLFTKTYMGFESLRNDFGREVAQGLRVMSLENTENGSMTPFEATTNTRPYTVEDLKEAFPDDWQKLNRASDEFREMYDEYIRDQNNMLATIYPIESEYDSVEKLAGDIEKKQDRRAQHRADVEARIKSIDEKVEQRIKARNESTNQRVSSIEKRIETLEAEMAKKKRTDTKAYRELQNRAFNLFADKENAIAEAAEYEAGQRAKAQALKDELLADLKEYTENVDSALEKMVTLKNAMQSDIQHGDDSLTRMHRLEYRKDYFHHFREMASDIQNLKSIFTGNTYISAATYGMDTKEGVAVRAKNGEVYSEKDNGDISPSIVGRSENTKAKSRWAKTYQKRGMGADYTADAVNGMLRYGQISEYKLAFDPLVAYLRDVNKQIRNLDDNTNRDGLIRYIDQWADAIAGKSHKLDRNISDLGMAPRKAMQILNWINSRVIQNTLLFNARSALIQISNITNAKGIVKNNIDWLNGLRSWALAAKGDEAMADIMAQSNFLASRYMDNLQLTDSKLKNAKAFGGWMLGALDEISAKATWWAAYQQYTRNPNAAKNQYRAYDNAIDYADDVTRRTHAGRGVGELAPAMTSRVINFVAPFQVEVNNTFQLAKDNVKQGNYLGILSTGLSVFLFNALFEGIVGSSPLQFDFIRAVLDIVLGFAQDDPKDDKDDYGILQAWQRLSGEAFGSLPYASQLASIIGEDTAKKLFGTDNDATRYGNTQIGVNAVINAVKGVKDIGTGLVEGRKVNWVDDLDDLLNLTLPFGAKQLTRSIQGIETAVKGYAGKYDKNGKEQVQFATDGDILEAIHAALFGKWALTEASEYFGEKRLLPQLFGEYNGPKSATGKAVDAKEYKAALQTGIDGKEYFTLRSDLGKYTTQPGKRAEMMQQKLTPEQKAKLDALMCAPKDAEMKTEGAVVYQKSSDGEWKVKADYTNQDMFDLSTAGDKAYTGTLEAMKKTGLPQDQAALAASMWDEAKKADDSKAAFRDMLRDNKNLTVEQKEALDLQYTGNKYPADYSDPELYDLSVTNRSKYEKAKEAKSKGVPVSTFTGLYDKKESYDGENKSDYVRQQIMSSNLSVKQKEMMDDLLVSNKGANPDYSAQAWFELSMISKTQYDKAKTGEKVGVKPEVYLAAYKKYKEVNRKEGDKYVNTKKEAKALLKKYLDGLRISAPVYDYIWTAVYGYKSR